MNIPCGLFSKQVSCCALLEKHPTMKPGKGTNGKRRKWGTMVDKDDQEYWTANICDKIVGGPKKHKCPCPAIRGSVI